MVAFFSTASFWHLKLVAVLPAATQVGLHMVPHAMDSKVFKHEFVCGSVLNDKLVCHWF